MSFELPLRGITILDVSRVLSGPYCTFLLAQLGAHVIKVELPETGDDSRQFGPSINGVSGYFASLNRGKESIALDLKAADDRQIFEALLSRADVLVENFRPQVMDRLGYGWQSVHERYPRLIYGSISGFGKQNSDNVEPAYDIIIQALSGIMSVTGKEKGDYNRVGVSIADLSSGLFLTIGILASLHKRETTGTGDIVDVAMLDSVLSLMEYPVMRYSVDGVSPGPIGSYRPAIPAPFGLFKTRDRVIVIAAGNQRLFRRLCEALPLDASFVERYDDPEVRKDNEQEITRHIESVLQLRDASEWIEVLKANGIPCAAVNDVADAVSLPTVKDGRLLDRQGIEPPFFLVSSPIRFPLDEQERACGKPPLLDEHREKILDMISSAAGDNAPAHKCAN
ncbi:MAG TPA: CoA transferase [Pyrinomonadaceae bacterium]|jgi:CoA:oxalate CoA-transferase